MIEHEVVLMSILNNTGTKMTATEIGATLTARITQQARELGAAVLSDRTPASARRYIGFVAELNPQVYTPPHDELKTALDLAASDVERAGLDRDAKRANYRYFREIAMLYTSHERVKIYGQMIESLNGSSPSHRH